MTRMARNYLFFDTETVAKRLTPSTEELSWRVGVSAYVEFDDARKKHNSPDFTVHETPEQLWEWASMVSKPRRRLVVTAHNLQFDTRISRAFRILPQLGWRMESPGFYRENLSVTWRRDDQASLVMVDSHSWLPMSLKRIGEKIGLPKLPDPPPDDDLGWIDRCVRDVEVLMAAMLEVWGMLERDDLGTWKKTGAGAAYNNWRHRHYTHQVLVHGVPEAEAAEQASLYAGRCEAWRWGKLPVQTYTEFDLGMAYARCARDLMLPVGGVRHHYGEPREWRAGVVSPRRFLLRASVLTKWPVLPTEGPSGVLWPTGELVGWYWDSELHLALEWGAEVKVSEAWSYKAAPALRQWGEWITDAVESPNSGYSPIEREALKHWSRALIGRFGARYQRWEETGPPPVETVALIPGLDVETREVFHYLWLDTQGFYSDSSDYGSDAVPAIQSAVVSECRQRLWRLMYVAGFDHIVYLDTDSLIVDPQGARRLEVWAKQHPRQALRVKTETRKLEVLGPRQLRLGDERRFAGVPRLAEERSDGALVGTVFESSAGAWTRRDVETVRIGEVVWRPVGVDNRRRHLEGGRTEPFEVSTSGGD